MYLYRRPEPIVHRVNEVPDNGHNGIDTELVSISGPVSTF
jgi:hypothetical protein